MSKSGQILDSMDLISAASVGDYGTVDNILRNKSQDVNSVNSSGWTALMYAANYGHYNIIRLLIRNDCDVDQRDWQGRTALMLAASNGHTRSIEVLISYGKADKKIKDLAGTNAYQYAKNCGHGNNKLIKSLLLNSSQNFPHELRGRAMTTRRESLAQVNQSKESDKDMKKETPTTNSDIYNPYQTTAFSSQLWKPIKSDVFKDLRSKDLRAIGSNESLASNGFSCSPPEINGQTLCDTSDEYALSSSQSSQCSAISLPADYKRKMYAVPKTFQMPSVMPKNLFHLLTRIDLIQYLDRFESNDIDFYQFLTLTDLDFQKLGITSFAHRKKLSIAQMRYHESLDINCSQESFLTDYLLNERDSMSQRIQELERKLQSLTSEDN